LNSFFSSAILINNKYYFQATIQLKSIKLAIIIPAVTNAQIAKQIYFFEDV